MEPIIYIKSYEFFILPLYIVLFFVLAFRIVKKYYADSSLGKFLYFGLAAKIVGSIAFALMSQYFFKEGDTFMYFSGGLDFKKFFLQNFPENFNLLVLPAEEYGDFYKLNADNINNFGYMSSGANLFTAKISSLFSLLSFNGYLITSVFFGMVAFSGMWRLFSLFSKIYPALTKQCGWCFLFLPSILYWGGGIMKDSLCLGAIGWLFSSFYAFFVLKQKNKSHIVMLFIGAYFLFMIKVYIAFTICAVLGIWFLVNLISSIKNKLIKRITLSAVIFICFTLLVVFVDEIVNLVNNEVVDIIAETVKEATKNYELSSTDSNASLSNIGDVQPNLTSIIAKIPIAINNALFRPYIWEARKLNILMSALENMAILLFTIFIFIKKGIFTTFAKIFTVQLIFFCFAFSILFAVLIGFTCFNYGSLVRYKLPCMPFYCFMLILLYYTDKSGKVLT